jgi:RNA polymerase sigma-70 factor, ECF subfamily
VATTPLARSEIPIAEDSAAVDRLLGAMCGGDPAALEELLEGFWEPLVRYATGFLQNSDDASDVVQDCFVRLWQGRNEWQGSGSGRAFLYRVVRNQALDELRKAGRRSRLAARARAVDPPRPPRPDELLAERELLAVIERAIADLPSRRREVFLLAHAHDLSYREIAEVLGISAQTAANQLCSALGSLRAGVGYLLRDSASPDAQRSESAHGPVPQRG